MTGRDSHSVASENPDERSRALDDARREFARCLTGAIVAEITAERASRVGSPAGADREPVAVRRTAER